jgi:hypothetical protein
MQNIVKKTSHVFSYGWANPLVAISIRVGPRTQVFRRYVAKENDDVVRLRELQELSNIVMCSQVEAVLCIPFLRTS